MGGGIQRKIVYEIGISHEIGTSHMHGRKSQGAGNLSSYPNMLYNNRSLFHFGREETKCIKVKIQVCVASSIFEVFGYLEVLLEAQLQPLQPLQQRILKH